LHFGSLLAALGSWLRARNRGGTWLLRIEDIDPPREVAGAALRIIDTLAAFGMQADGPITYQSTRSALYAAALDRLRDAGAAFECRCSRSALAPAGIHRTCSGAAVTGRPPAWRVRVPDIEIGFVDLLQGPQRQNLATEVGDFVVLRADGWAAYQLAVVVDDAAQGITEVVRGADLLDSTARQIHLQGLLGLPTPDYLHLPLVVGPDGSKLSKQAASLAVDPRDPLPPLRAALGALGYDGRLFDGLRSPQAILALACGEFRLEALPAVPSLPLPAASPSR
jgi:glutamyl-Q tRNA(Asp) synthetase